MTNHLRIRTSTVLALAALAAAIPSQAAASGGRHCAMATASTPQICSTTSPVHHIDVVVSGKWAAKHPTATITGYIFMGGSRTDFTFVRQGTDADPSWTASANLPAGRVWTLKITIPTASGGSKTISMIANLS